MSRKKKLKTDDASSQVETTETEAKEDSYTGSLQETLAPLDDLEDSELGKGDTSPDASAPAAEDAATDVGEDGGSEPKKPDSASSAPSPSPSEDQKPAEDASASTGEGPNEAPADTKQGDIMDMADMAVKGLDGEVKDDSNTSVAVDAPAEGSDETKGQLAAEAAKIGGDDTVTAAPSEATATDSASSVAAVQHSIQVDQDARQDAEPAVGSSKYLEAAAKAELDRPKPVDPATLPGMAPVEPVGTVAAGLVVETTSKDS